MQEDAGKGAVHVHSTVAVDVDDAQFSEAGCASPFSRPGCHTYDLMTKSTRLSFSVLSFLSVPPESACGATKNIRSGSILASRR